MQKKGLFHLPVTATIFMIGMETPRVTAMVGGHLVFRQTLSLNTGASPSVEKIFKGSRGMTFERLEDENKTRMRVFTGILIDEINGMIAENFGEKLPEGLKIGVEGLNPLLVQSLISRICVEYGDNDSRWLVESQHPLPGFCTEYIEGKLQVGKVIKVPGPLGNETRFASLGSVFHRPALSRGDGYSSPVCPPVQLASR